MIQHRAGKLHGKADALLRREEDTCNRYHTGHIYKSLPCDGCYYCQRVEKQWGRFSEEVDYIAPLATRRIELSRTVCNWKDKYDLKTAQSDDDEAQLEKFDFAW